MYLFIHFSHAYIHVYIYVSIFPLDLLVNWLCIGDPDPSC